MATQRRRKRKVGPLTTLTPKQETFALNIHAGMTNKDAYLDAYDIKNASLNTIYQNSSKLLKNPKIVMRLNQLEEESIRVTKVSLRKHLERLNELGQGAESAQQFAAAINAELNRGKASGLYINRQEIFGHGGGPVDCSIKVSFGDDDDEEEVDELEELE